MAKMRTNREKYATKTFVTTVATLKCVDEKADEFVTVEVEIDGKEKDEAEIKKRAAWELFHQGKAHILPYKVLYIEYKESKYRISYSNFKAYGEPVGADYKGDDEEE